MCRAFKGDLLRAFLGALTAREARLARDTERYACARDAFMLHMLRVRTGSGALQATAADAGHSPPGAAAAAGRTHAVGGSNRLPGTPGGGNEGSLTLAKPFNNIPQLRPAVHPGACLGCAAALAAAFAGCCANPDQNPDQSEGFAGDKFDPTKEARAARRELHAVGCTLAVQADHRAGAGTP